jgi:large subunit ribosomal protein L23
MSINDEVIGGASSQHFSIIRKPIMTEKGANLGVLTLAVDPRASKTAIREAVERVFKVKVTAVRTANYAGKPKRVGRSVGRRSSYKKAYVSLAEGSEINILEGV